MNTLSQTRHRYDDEGGRSNLKDQCEKLTDCHTSLTLCNDGIIYFGQSLKCGKFLQIKKNQTGL